ncbi:DUF927 domain-containing protein [Brevibacillus borstelensis]|uniref:DUF927 domain-containing protein n=1 Tax=Brevibacillus borstelensis TaxID=45462 RepID=UPI00203D1F5F|nr:DUF927 domain-containing protein [Brevibacillus borstelensis]MCM3625121.1 DUF927 domain-containing protein [Brevibacillus borstelensis]
MPKEKCKIVRKGGRLVDLTNGEMVDLGAAIDVDKYVTNVDTAEVTVHLSFIDNGKRVHKSLKRDEINEKRISQLTRYGADCWPEVAEEYTKHLRKQIAKKERNYEHSHIGWGSYEDQTYFKLHKGIGFPSEYDGLKFDLKPKGSLEAWKQMVSEEVRGNRWLEFALAAGFTAPLLSILKEEAHMDSLFFNLCGISTTGKTLTTRLAVSAFGRPDTRKKGLLVTWYGTDQGILHHLRGNYGVPLVIDDTSMQEDQKDYTQFIYLIAGGQEKMALTSQGTKREQADWMTTVFSSSENSILENTDKRSGIRVRFFEIKEPNLTASAENAERIEKVVMKNYGHAGRVYVKYLMKIGNDEIHTRWRQTRQNLLARMEEKDGFTKRIAGKLAIVQLAGELANEALDLGLNKSQLIDSLLHIENKSMKDRNKGDEAYQFLMGYFVRNRHKFFRDKSEWDKNKPIVGKYVEKGGIVTQIQIPKEEFEKLMKQEKFNVEQVVSEWKESERLIHDAGKNTLTRVFQPGVPKMPQYVFKVETINNDEKQTNGAENPAVRKQSSVKELRQIKSKAPQVQEKRTTQVGFSLQKGPTPDWMKDAEQVLLEIE